MRSSDAIYFEAICVERSLYLHLLASLHLLPSICLPSFA